MMTDILFLEMTSYLAHVRELQRADECSRLVKYSTFRQADLALLQKHKEIRKEVSESGNMLQSDRQR